MTDKEFAVRSQLKWQRDGDVWILLYCRKRMGRVLPDNEFPGMWRSVKSNGLSDMANLSWSKDAVLAQAVRELAYEAANNPSKPHSRTEIVTHSFKCVWGPSDSGPMMPPQRALRHEAVLSRTVKRLAVGAHYLASAGVPLATSSRSSSSRHVKRLTVPKGDAECVGYRH